MKIRDINYYVKFIFSSTDGRDCLSTTDKEILNFIKSEKTHKPTREYSVGDIIYLEADSDSKYKVTDIAIRQLVDDTDMLKIGFDRSDKTDITGEYKEPLFIIDIAVDRL